MNAAKTNIVDGIDELAPAAKLTDGTSYSTEYDVESWLGRAHYNYDDKYYFSASFRRRWFFPFLQGQSLGYITGL